ncbi:MAG: MarR family transcriptional regulator [Bacillota bacterium]
MAAQDKEQFDSLLRELFLITKRRFRDVLSGSGMTPPQFHALVAIDRHGEPTMGELGDVLFLASSTLTDLVDRLEKDALAERVRDPEDRRAIRIKLTGRGRADLAAVQEARRRYLTQVLGELGPERAKLLIAALQELVSVMTRVPTP